MTQSAAPTAPRNTFGIIALLLAVIGLLVGLVRLPGFVSLILGMVAVLFGLVGCSRIGRGGAIKRINRTTTMIGVVLGLATAALGIWGIGTGRGVLEGSAGPHDNGHVGAAIEDVAVVDCPLISEDGGRTVNATVKITNTTDRAQTYQTTIQVNDASGARIGRINTVSNSLSAGQSVTVSGAAASDTAVSGARAGPLSCVVANVNRFPATMNCPPGEVDAKLC